ncbi:ABC transporter permease subunit [Nostocoides sp. F2B08]|uniref:ABC transporter permease n=1 Tax=Nostocoides sp. F2B08 TaxID=2653936 RepID=UPI0012637204|nr:ABC transporter permease [Tetrasphaera sp. F2B08]KAB7744082.1 ABC transporter permease subunit [Tetrasphaera sp. F2B08]
MSDLTETSGDRVPAEGAPAASAREPSGQQEHRHGALSYAAEWARQLTRRRTQWIFGILVVLPVIFIAAFALDDGPSRGEQGTRFVDIATSGGPNFSVFVLLVSGELLLYIVAALLVGDPVPAEASWSSLRYLLTAPVRRARLLTSKLLVGLSALAVATILLPLWSLLLGGFVYGMSDYQIPGGGELDSATFWSRIAIAIGYVFVATLPIAGIAFLVGVRTDTPLAAVGAALMVYIVAGILDSIDALGDWRKALPGHYGREWLELLTTTDPDWTGMQRGLLWSLLYFTIFVVLGYRVFRRKDILS